MIGISTKPNYKYTVMNLFIHREILKISSLEKRGQNYSTRTWDFLMSLGIFFSCKKQNLCIFPERRIFPDIFASHIFIRLCLCNVFSRF